MKYLKKFEIVGLKKYVIIKGHYTFFRLFIVEITNIENNYVVTKDIFQMTINDDKPKAVENWNRRPYNSVIEDILYQSDDLEDCKNKLSEMISASKYNL